MKFRIGDKVRAKERTIYGITTNGWEGEVVCIYEEYGRLVDIEVKGKDTGTFPVESKYFDLISSKQSMEFKVGDKVICVKDYVDKVKVGLKGVIVDMESSIGVEWEEDIGGHDCGGYCKSGYGYFVNRDNIKLLTSSDETNKWRTIKMKLNSMMKRLLDADTKKLIEGGIIDGNLELTEEGELALQAILFSEKKEELVKVAEEKIAEEKKGGK